MIQPIRLGFVPSYRFGFSPWCQRMRDESLAALARVEGIEVVVPQPALDGRLDAQRGLTPHGAVRDLDEADAVAAYFAGRAVDGLVLCPLDFGDERSAAKIAEKLRVPILLYATKEPEARNDATMGRHSDSYCGNLSIAAALYRRKLPFYYAGIYFPDEPALIDEFRIFAQAVAVVAGLKGARLAQVGVRPATFETVGYDEAALIRKFGQNVIFAELADLTDEARGYPDDDARVSQSLAEARASVSHVTVGDDYMLAAAKLNVALAEFWRKSRLSAMAVQCWPAIQRLMGISVCAIYGQLTATGMLIACEADILGAESMLISYRAAMGRTVPHFIDWTIQHRRNPNWLLAWHCGNAPACLASDPSRTALRSRNNMTGSLAVEHGDALAGLYQFQIKPGVVTICRLAEYDDRWKLLIARGEIVPSDETLAGTWAWVQVRDHADLYRTLVEEGFVHHASMIHGDQVRALQQVCRFMDIQPVLVE